MNNTQKETIIQNYFQSWIDKDSSVMESCFSDFIIYIECYGPEYRGKAECLRWFEEWNKKGQVLEWRIKNFYHDSSPITAGNPECSVVEWYFRCEYEATTDGFDGVSIIDFEQGLISAVREFQSKSEHFRPYGNMEKTSPN